MKLLRSVGFSKKYYNGKCRSPDKDVKSILRSNKVIFEQI